MVASPLRPELAQRIAAVDPRVELLYDPAVLPAQRFPGDVSGDRGFTPDSGPWRELLARADVLYGVPGGSGRQLAEALAHAPHVRWVQARNAGAGEQVAAALAADPHALDGVVVTAARGVHGGPLAEFALLGLLAFAKRLPALEQGRRERAWPAQRTPSRTLRGQTLLLLGLGGLGAEVARLAAAFGMRVLGVRRRPLAPGETVAHVEEVHPPSALAELAPRADALVVTLPHTPESEGLVSAEVLGALREGAVVVNVGRGAVIDEPALVARLQDGHLGGAALDVFAQEPLPPESPLWALPNVILSPHAAALTEDEDERTLEVFAENLRRWLAGEPLRHEVDVRAGY